MSGEVREELKDVQQIQASTYAFAALKSSGEVVTWGGDVSAQSQEVQQQLKDVQQ